MESLTQIVHRLDDSFEQVSAWIEQQENAHFVEGPKDKWKTSGHLDHLTQTAEMVAKGLRIPRPILRWKFGKPNRSLRNYEEVCTRYKEKLENIPHGVTSPMTIHDFTIEQKNSCLKKFNKAGTLVSKLASKCSESKLDTYLLPHPLMGCDHAS